MFTHAVLVTDNDIRSYTGGDYLRYGKLLGSWVSSKVACAYHSKEGQPLIWTDSTDNLSCTFGVHPCEKPDAFQLSGCPPAIALVERT